MELEFDCVIVLCNYMDPTSLSTMEVVEVDLAALDGSMTATEASGYQKNWPKQHKRRKNLIILCQLRLALRLLYYSSLSPWKTLLLLPTREADALKLTQFQGPQNRPFALHHRHGIPSSGTISPAYVVHQWPVGSHRNFLSLPHI
jgi:hypothetical protein